MVASLTNIHSSRLICVVVACILLLVDVATISSASPADPSGPDSKGRHLGPYAHILPFEVGGLTRASNGQFLAQIAIGQPPRRFSVSVSTSVSLLVVACGACGDDRMTYETSASSSHFNVHNANSFSEDIIGAFDTYHIHGNQEFDHVCVGNACLPDINGARLEFGCLKTCPAEFQKQVPDGILGLSAERPSDTLLNSLVRARKMKRRMFSMCIGKETGALAIGGVMPQAVHLSKTQFGRMETSWSYLLHMRSIGVGTANHVATDLNVPLLTSVAHTFVPKAIFTNLRDHILRHCVVSELHAIDSPSSIKTSHCGVIEATQEVHKYDQVVCIRQAHGVSFDQFMSRLPSINIWVDGFQHDHSATNNTGLSELLIKPEYYMTNSDPDDLMKWCSSIVLSHSHHMYLGSDVMRGHEWVFDLDRGEMAWTPAQCDGVHAAATAPPSHAPPPHIATKSPTTIGDEVACCVGMNCTAAQLSASLALNQLRFVSPSSLHFRPTKVHPVLDCVDLKSNTMLMVEPSPPNSNDFEVSICPIRKSRCAFAYGSWLINLQAKNVLVGSLMGIGGLYVDRNSHVRVNGFVVQYNTDRHHASSSSTVAGVLETTNNGATHDHVKLQFGAKRLMVYGTLLFNTATDVSCVDPSASEGVTAIGTFGNIARIHVKNARTVFMQCPLHLDRHSLLILDAKRITAMNYRRGSLHVPTIFGVGTIQFNLCLELLDYEYRFSHGIKTNMPELGAPELRIGIIGKRPFTGVVEVSLYANTIPDDFSVEPKEEYYNVLVIRKLANSEMKNQRYKIDAKLWCMGAIVRYDGGYTNLYVPFNPACVLECARHGETHGFDARQVQCERDALWRKHAALQSGSTGTVTKWVTFTPIPSANDPKTDGSVNGTSPGGSINAPETGGSTAVVVVIAAVLSTVCVVVYKRPRTALRAVTSPRRMLTTLLGGGIGGRRRSRMDGISGDDPSELFDSESSVVREMTTVTSTRLPTASAVPAPETLGYELQES